MHTSNDHIKAWEIEHQKSIWKGPYSLDFFLEYAAASGNILDAGCGIGRYTIPIALRCDTITGVDVSATAIKKLDQQRQRRNLYMDLAAADVCNLPFRTGVFDTIICAGVLQHLLEKERIKAAGELGRVLVPGGIIVVEVLGREDMRVGGIEVEPFTYKRQTGTVYHYFQMVELVRLFSPLELVGLKDEKIPRTINGKKYIHHRIAIAVKRSS